MQAYDAVCRILGYHLFVKERRHVCTPEVLLPEGEVGPNAVVLDVFPRGVRRRSRNALKTSCEYLEILEGVIGQHSAEGLGRDHEDPARAEVVPTYVST
jgi:hypothetical protein